MVFFYYSNHGVPVGRFKNRVEWQGNMSRWDGSIRLRDVRVNDSGTYECELRLLQNSSIFRGRTVLHVSPAVPRGRGSPSAQARGAVCWPAPAVALVACPVTGVRQPLCVWGCPVPNTPICPLQEAIYSSIPGAEVPKAEQEAKKKRRAEDTYITMHPSHCRDNGVYVELAKREIPSEWMAEGTRGDGQGEEPHSRPEEALPWAPEREE
ncbi:JAML protein, partial [Pachycephala philippinensis]|nr:JAML protein [Pachycephala philippinensis]